MNGGHADAAAAGGALLRTPIGGRGVDGGHAGARRQPGGDLMRTAAGGHAGLAGRRIGCCVRVHMLKGFYAGTCRFPYSINPVFMRVCRDCQADPEDSCEGVR